MCLKLGTNITGQKTHCICAVNSSVKEKKTLSTHIQFIWDLPLQP